MIAIRKSGDSINTKSNSVSTATAIPTRRKTAATLTTL